jgi:hypothetical protein
MSLPSERVLCRFSVSNADIILTSARVIAQSAPPLSKAFHFIAAPSGSLCSHVAWGEAGYGGVIATESQDPPNIIDPKRIIHSIPYDEITEVTTGPRGYEIRTKEKPVAFSFTLDELCFGVLYHFLSHILGDEIVFPGYTLPFKLLWLSGFCRHLNGLGYQAEIVRCTPNVKPEVGIIRLGQRNIDLVTKTASFGEGSLEFTILGVEGKVEGLTLKKRKKGREVAFEWVGRSKRLAQALNSDPTLVEQLLSWRQSKNIGLSITKVWKKGLLMPGRSSGTGISYEVQEYVSIQDLFVESLPPTGYFEAIDQVAHYVRSM